MEIVGRSPVLTGIRVVVGNLSLRSWTAIKDREKRKEKIRR